jgi:hypothetical protein
MRLARSRLCLIGSAHTPQMGYPPPMTQPTENAIEGQV